MTKLKPRFYAQALWELTTGKDEKERKIIIDNLLRLLQKNKQLKMWSQVVKAYEQLLQEKEAVILATVKTTQTLTTEELAKITAFLMKTEKAKTVELKIKNCSPNLGLIIETDEKRWDLSLDKQIKNLKKQLIS